MHKRLLTAFAVALALAGCGGSKSSAPPQHVAPPHHVGPPHHVPPPRRAAPLLTVFEAGPQLLSDPAATLDTFQSLGVDVVKVFVPWGDLVPPGGTSTPPAGFDGNDPAAYPATAWAPYDAIVQDAAARGIGVDLTPAEPPPSWAQGPGAPAGAGSQWKPSAALFGQFVHAVGERYSGSYTPAGASSPLPRVSIWSIWNEPNYGPELKPQAIDNWRIPISPSIYRGLVDSAWTALHATGHGSDTILIGELAPRGVQSADGMVPLRFVRSLYCLGPSLTPLHGQTATQQGCPATTAGSNRFRGENPALFKAGGFSDHPYPQGEAQPTARTPNEPDYADFAALPTLIATLDRAQQAYGSRKRFPIWSTEFGYATDPPRADEASPATAAGLLNWAEYLSWRNPRLRSYDQYQLLDPAVGSEFVTGLEFNDGRPKATYDAFRMPLWLPVSKFASGQAIEVWGCVRPARFARRSAGAAQRVRIQFERAGATAFKTVATVRLSDAYGYFDVRRAFPGTGSVRLAWRYPHGPEVFSRTVAVSAR